MTSSWTIKYTPVGASAPVLALAKDLGLSDLSLEFHSHAADLATVTADLAVDEARLFTTKSRATIYQDEVPVFAGSFIKPRASARPRSERHTYQIAGPWQYLERLTFQQVWQQIGEGGMFVPTTRTMINVMQAPDRSKWHMGQMLTAVLDYVIACGLAEDPAFTYFAKGAMMPNIIIPYAQEKDVTCAQFLLNLLAWVPDSVTWFTYDNIIEGEVVPLFNISRRGALPAKSIALLDGERGSAIDISPRDDLVVPAVICKFTATNTDDGKAKSVTSVQKYPLDASDVALDTLVVECELQGSNRTYQKQKIIVTDCPVSPADSIAKPWTLRKVSWLNDKDGAGHLLYDTAHMAVTAVVTALTENDKQATDPDPGFHLEAMTRELIDGSVSDWMKQDLGVFSCVVNKTITLIYTGTDELTASLFYNGEKTIYVTDLTVTNADSKEYMELVSQEVGEAEPEGMAQALYEGLSVLHYEGAVELGEDEVTRDISLGNQFNIADGAEEWKTMNAQINSIVYDVDAGKTRVNFGPSPELSLQQREEMQRASRRRIASSALVERTNGETGDATQVEGHRHGRHGYITAPPFPQPDGSDWQLIWRRKLTDPTNFEGKIVLKSSVFATLVGSSNYAITGLDTWGDLIDGDIWWLLAAVTNGAPVAGSLTIHSKGQGHTDYDPNAAYWATGGPIEYDSPSTKKQTIIRVPLNKVAAVGGKPSVTQLARTSLIVKNATLAGIPGIYLFSKT